MNRGGLMNYYIGLVPFASEPYLAHYGVKGMKWGVRRYQNPDGTFTKAGKARYAHLYKNTVEYDVVNRTNAEQDKIIRDYYRKVRKDSGVKSGDKNTEILKKGTKVQRSAYGDETVDDKRKYVALTEHDKDKYSDMFYFSDKAEQRGGYYIDEYELTKDIKIASVEKIRDWVLNEFGEKPIREVTDSWTGSNRNDYGWEKLKDVFDDPVIRDTKIDFIDTHKSPSGTIEFGGKNLKNRADVLLADSVAKRINAGRKIISLMMGQNMHMKSEVRGLDKMLSELKAEGYDAVVDIEDYRDFAEYPLILLNPADSMKRTKHEKYEG